MTKLIHPITFIDKLVKKNEVGESFILMDHQREILRSAFDFDQDGHLPWDTILYSCVKKSGKTTINAALTRGWALTQEAPNEIPILANHREQALSRVFKAIDGMIHYNEPLRAECEVQSKVIYCVNGTEIKALSSEHSTAAGAVM
jgi:phage terminase large subunit-like protein